MRFLMRSQMRFWAISLTAVAAAGCASMRAHEVGALLDPYVGQTVSAVIDRFGPPSGNYASSTVAMTYQWNNFGSQSGMSGCKVLVEAHRTAPASSAAAGAFRTEPIGPEEYNKWTIDTWSSFGSGCR
jgi:hypothetical protein